MAEKRGTRRMHVVVTGATGTVGRGLVPLLEGHPRIASVLALGSRSDPGGLPVGRRVRYRQIDVRDAEALRDACAGADAVVHLAFSFYGLRQSERELRAINVGGTRNAYEAARAAGAKRFVYTSSSAAYGYHADQPQPITEETPLRPDGRHFYSRQKAEIERYLTTQRASGGGPEIVVFRPCAVIGPDAAGAAGHGFPGWLSPAAAAVRGLYAAGVRPLLPGPPVPLQFVHEEDVGSAILAALLRRGAGGTYNLAGDGALDGDEVLRALGMHPLPVPRVLTRTTTRALAGLPKPFVPGAGWLHVLAHPLLLDTAAAKRRLGWEPRYTSRGAVESLGAALGA